MLASNKDCLKNLLIYVFTPNQYVFLLWVSNKCDNHKKEKKQEISD